MNAERMSEGETTTKARQKEYNTKKILIELCKTIFLFFYYSHFAKMKRREVKQKIEKKQ